MHRMIPYEGFLCPALRRVKDTLVWAADAHLHPEWRDRTLEVDRELYAQDRVAECSAAFWVFCSLGDSNDEIEWALEKLDLGEPRDLYRSINVGDVPRHYWPRLMGHMLEVELERLDARDAAIKALPDLPHINAESSLSREARTQPAVPPPTTT